MGHKDLMPFHFWLDCFEFNNLRDTYERLCAIEDACALEVENLQLRCFQFWQGSWEDMIQWETPETSQIAALTEATDFAMLEHKDAMFARKVLEVELENHNYLTITFHYFTCGNVGYKIIL